ncbi:hypothetical protein EBF04_00100 [Streptomyces sp. I6]|nr:hypothetical protein EBF04_00100 [Streptomyces sp. I6]
MDTLTVDRADPREGVLLGRTSSYPAEFRNDAVALYRAAGGKRRYAAVAVDDGVTGETLPSWGRQADEHAGRAHSQGEQSAGSRDEELARLRAENGRPRPLTPQLFGPGAALRVGCEAGIGEALPPGGCLPTAEASVPGGRARGRKASSTMRRRLSAAPLRGSRQAHDLPADIVVTVRSRTGADLWDGEGSPGSGARAGTRGWPTACRRRHCRTAPW